jgi:Ca2+-binding EF-hand superfamily protein
MIDVRSYVDYSQAFNLMDQDRDGTISLDDLKEVYASLGSQSLLSVSHIVEHSIDSRQSTERYGTKGDA